MYFTTVFYELHEMRMHSFLVAGAESGPKDTAYSMVQGSSAAAKVDILFRNSLEPKAG